jgi:hypothetical protein
MNDFLNSLFSFLPVLAIIASTFGIVLSGVVALRARKALYEQKHREFLELQDRVKEGKSNNT